MADTEEPILETCQSNDTGIIIETGLQFSISPYQQTGVVFAWSDRNLQRSLVFKDGQQTSQIVHSRHCFFVRPSGSSAYRFGRPSSFICIEVVGVYSGGWRERQDAKGIQDSFRNAKRLVSPILRKIGDCEQFANVKDKCYSAVVYFGSSLKFQSFIFCSQIVGE